jgi:hypothetical protein
VRQLTVIVLVLLLTASSASARGHVTRRAGRAQAVALVSPFVDLMDVHRTVRPVMAPARECLQVNRSTVACRFAVVLGGRTVRGRVVVHRQRDGLLGFRVTPDLTRFWVPSE